MGIGDRLNRLDRPNRLNGRRGRGVRLFMSLKRFHCKQCGYCCLNLLEAYYTTLHPEDIETWRKQGRHDILAWIVVTPTNNPHDKYHAWVSPITGEHVERCPWLRKLPHKNAYMCRIQDVKPKHCREYPTSRKHAEDTGCKGFEYKKLK